MLDAALFHRYLSVPDPLWLAVGGAGDPRHQRVAPDVHIYPEGTVSSRLADGRRGTVQFARALGIPILPVGMSDATSSLMDRLDALLAPEYRRVPGGRADGTSGGARFL